MPEREDFDPLWVAEQPVVDVIANAREPKAANAGQGHVRGTGPYVGLGRDDRGSAFNLFADGIRGFRAVETPPIFGSANSALWRDQ